MLILKTPEIEFWDENNEQFISVKSYELKLEHSLVSVSKWESKWKKPFLSGVDKTTEEIRDYIRCMTLTQNVDPNVYLSLSKENLDDASKYIDDTMTATWFSDDPKNTKKTPTRKSRETITSELVYYWMIAQNIPFECQKWHLNRLLTLIRVCSIKNTPPKKMSKSEILRSQRMINEERRKAYNSKG